MGLLVSIVSTRALVSFRKDIIKGLLYDKVFYFIKLHKMLVIFFFDNS
jgi:hypothetical protein